MTKVTTGFIATFVAPLVPAVIATLSDRKPLGLFEFSAGVSVFYFFTLLAMVVLGVPVFLLCLRFRLVRWWSAMIIGPAVAICADALVFWHIPPRSEALYMALLGVSCSMTFWLVLNMGRPLSGYLPEAESGVSTNSHDPKQS